MLKQKLCDEWGERGTLETISTQIMKYAGSTLFVNLWFMDRAIGSLAVKSALVGSYMTDGKSIVCKHQIALYFSLFPEKAVQFYEDLIAHEEEAAKEEEELYEKVQNRILNMKKSEAQNALAQVLFDEPEWQFDKFVREYVEDWYPFIVPNDHLT